MAVTRIKAYHGVEAGNGNNSAIQNSLDYITNHEKTDASLHQDRFNNNDPLMLDSNTINAFDYSTNPNKTTFNPEEFGLNEEPKRAEYDASKTPGQKFVASQELVSGYMCDPKLAATMFKSTMNLYRMTHEEKLAEQTAKRIFRAKLDENGVPVLDANGEMIYDEKAPVWHDANGKCRYQQYKREMQPRTAYMWVLSFPPESVCGYKIDPRICHQIGLEFCRQIGGGQHQAVVATHMDREHPHDHIVMCAYSKDGTHKYRDTMDSLMYARQICDDLSRKFGLPVLPSVSQEQGKAVDWAEWKSKQEGQSWKEQMRQDINGAVRIAKDYEQFVSIMKDSGYGIRETENHITYIMPGEDEYRCRDKRLGKEYEKSYIKQHFDKKNELSKEEIEEDMKREFDTQVVSSKKKKKAIHIHVSRYTLSGRRRSDIEMIFLAAIKILQALKDMFRDMDASNAQPMNPVHRDYAWKTRQMIDSMKMAQDLGIDNKKDLDELVNETGTKLSIVKKEVKELELDAAYAQKVGDLLDDIERYRPIAEKAGFDEANLFLKRPDEKTVRHNKAAENPATPAQRRNLYTLLQKSDNLYRLSCKYDELNAREAENVIQFLQKKSKVKPTVLINYSFDDPDGFPTKYARILEKRLASEKEKYNGKITSMQEKRIIDILEGRAEDVQQDKLKKLENIELDTDKLTKYDAMQLINYFTAKSPLTTPIADVMSQDKIEMMIAADEDKTLTLSRPAETLTYGDVKEIESYLKLLPDRRKYVSKPSVLKPYEEPNMSHVEQANELLSLRNVSISVPVEKLSKSEIYELTSYLLKLDAVPDCLKEEIEKLDLKNDALFNNRLLDYDIPTQQAIAHLRDSMQQLLDLGITPDDYITEGKRIKNDLNYLHDRLQDIEDLKQQYKNLQRLKYNYSLASNPVFTHGAKYGKQDNETVEVEERGEEQAQRTEEERREDENIEKQEQKNRYKPSDPRVFSFTDIYFDQTHPL